MVWMLLSSIINIYIYIYIYKHIDDTSSVIYKSNLISVCTYLQVFDKTKNYFG